MFERFSRSWSLIKASAAVLRADSELLVFPLVSSIAALIVAASFLLPLGLLGAGNAESWQPGELDIVLLAWAFAFYFCQYFVIFFFNTALVGAAMIRLDGGDPSLGDGLRIAWSRVGVLLGYAAIAASVGLLLRVLEQRAGWLGRLASSFFGVAWTFASFLVVPVLVSRNIGPLDAVKESATLLRKTWGENLIGSAGIGLVGGLLILLVAVLGVALAVAAFIAGAVALGIGLLVLTGLCLLAIGLLQAALAGIYSAALYRYASLGEAPAGFDGALLANAFHRKG